MAFASETIRSKATPASRDGPTLESSDRKGADSGLGGELGGEIAYVQPMSGSTACSASATKTEYTVASPERVETAGELGSALETAATMPMRNPLESRTNMLDDEGEELDNALFYRKRFLAYSTRGPQPLCQEKLQELCVEMENASPSCAIESSPIGQALIDRKRFHSRRRLTSPRSSPRKCGSAHGRGAILRTERELNL